MGWEHFNLNLLEAFDFEITAKHLILRVFDSASAALDEEWNKYVAHFDAHISEEMDESQVGFAFHERDWEEHSHSQRMQGVGALALDWLMCSLQGALHSAKKYLDATHPQNLAGYKGDGWLHKVKTEYQQRFGIDFKQGPTSFDRIEELVLARNAGIHRDDGNLKTYLAKVQKPAFVDREDQFCVTRDALVAIMKDCEEFLKWAIAELTKLRPASAVKKSGN